MEQSNPVWDLLHSTPLETLCVKEKVTCLKDTQTIEEAVKHLGDTKILSAPVVDSKGQCIGVLDVLDIVTFVLSVAPDPSSIARDKLQSLEISGRAMAFEQIKNIIDASGRDPYVPVYAHNPASQAVAYFAKGVHRIPLVDDKNEVTHTVSQSDVNRFLAKNLHMGKPKVMGDLTAKEVGLGVGQNLVSVKKSETVLVALNKIKTAGVSALAVVDDNNKLIGNFSASDLKGMFKEQFPSFLLTVEEYLQKHSPNSLSPVCVRTDTKFADVVKELADNKIHRLWVLGNEFEAAGVISLTNVMAVAQNFRLTAATTHH